jgi:hypothetical protein
MNDHVEAVARAIAGDRASEFGKDWKWDELYKFAQDRYRSHARAAIAAYQQSCASEAVAWLHTWKEKSGETGKSVRFSRADQELAATNLDRYLVAMVKGSSEITPLFAAPPAPVVRVKPLVWNNNGSQYYAYCRTTTLTWIAKNSDEKKAREAERTDLILSALESAPPAPAVPAGWLPIETAPKDGTYIDVWTRNGERVTDAKWEVKKNRWVHWGFSNFDNMCFVRLDSFPTHWMPLPAVPEAP